MSAVRVEEVSVPKASVGLTWPQPTRTSCACPSTSGGQIFFVIFILSFSVSGDDPSTCAATSTSFVTANVHSIFECEMGQSTVLTVRWKISHNTDHSWIQELS